MSTRALSQDAAVAVGQTTAAVIAWQYRGELRVTAIVKATFAFAADAVMARVLPQPIRVDEVHSGKSLLQSIRFASDLAPYRRRADVLFTGYAHAPAGTTVESMRVRFGLFSSGPGERALLDKALLVRKKGGFERLPLDYEHAFGGIGYPENPFGEGFSDDGEPDELHVLDPAEPRRVAGFAPIPRTMDPRRRLLGALPLPSFGAEVVQIPDDFNFDFFQCSPVDQRLDSLRGDEWIILEGLHPTVPIMRTRLPSARGLARIHGLSELGIPEGQALAMQADLLHVSGDEEQCVVTWRGSFPVSGGAGLASARVVVGVESAGEPVAWPDPAELLARAAAPSPTTPRRGPPRGGDQTLALSDVEPAARVVPPTPPTLEQTIMAGAAPEHSPRPGTLPFKASPTKVPALAVGRSRHLARSGSDGATLPIPSSASSAGVAQPAVALPFLGPAASPPAPPPAPPREEPTSRAPVADPASTKVAVVEAPPAREPAPQASPEIPRSASSPWAPQPAPQAASAPLPKKRLPPNVDVGSKLYGSWKKSR